MRVGWLLAALVALPIGSLSQAGSGRLPVSIVVYSDFECPFCRAEALMLRENLPAYADRVRVTFKDAPAEPVHPWARAAALAGRCVYSQNEDAFWRYHDWMFAHQAEITPQNIGAKVLSWAAGEPKVDSFQLTRCIGTGAAEGEVEKSLAEARAIGVTKLPTLFVNGRKFEEAVPWDKLRAAIDQEIAQGKPKRVQ